MNIYIFTGPTISPASAAQVLDAVYLPPAAQGDIYRVSRLRPQAIGLIDGLFETVPAVWHKEILWAMSQGVHVFGCSSMGALRAAELAAFGMEGVGTIFQQYRDGLLEDDDEVAVAHAPATHGYRSISIALVNIRATLEAAVAQHVVAAATGQTLLQIAKGLFYPERSYAQVLMAAQQSGVDSRELTALREWLPGGQVDQKRADALAMLRTIRGRLEAGLEPKQVRYHFEHTIFWDHVQRDTGSTDEPEALSDEPDQIEGLLDEARLSVSDYQLAHRSVLIRQLSQSLAQIQGDAVTSERVEEAILSFRRGHNLTQPHEVDPWLAQHDLSLEQYVRLMGEDALARAVVCQVASNTRLAVLERLKLADTYPRLRARALHKQQLLATAGLSNASLENLGLDHHALLEWYFTQRLGREVPRALDQYASEAGFTNLALFLTALLREYAYISLQASATPQAA
jgi:hypothetical protein